MDNFDDVIVQDPQMRKEESVMEVCLARKCCFGDVKLGVHLRRGPLRVVRAVTSTEEQTSVTLVQAHQLAVELAEAEAGDVPKKSCEKMVIGGERMSNWTENRVVDWARDHFSAINSLSLGTGRNRLVFSKSGRRSWTLLGRGSHHSQETLSGIRALMFDLGYTLADEETVWDEAPKTRRKRKKSKLCRRGHRQLVDRYR